MGLPRSTYYDEPTAPADDTAIVEAIAIICDEFEDYGCRRVGAALRQDGMVVNHKKIRRLMREHDLQPRVRRRFVATTDSDHDGPIFPNRAADLVVDGPNQLWVADITYVAITAGFVYVAIILDAWSRRVVGYALSRSIDARLTVAALKAAIAARTLRQDASITPTADRKADSSGRRNTWKRRLRWAFESDDRIGLDARRCHRRADRLWRDAMNAGGSGPAIASGDEQRGCCVRGRCVATCRCQIVPEGGRHATSDVQVFGEAALRAIPLAWWSERRSRFFGSRAAPCRRLGVGSADRPLRSPVSYGATPPPVAGGWSIARRPPSGTPSDQPGVRSRRSLRSIRLCALMSRKGWLEWSSLRAAVPFPVLRFPGRDAGMASDRIDDGPEHGARSRSPSACRSTSRTTRRCASATKPSIRRSSSKAEGHFAAN